MHLKRPIHFTLALGTFALGISQLPAQTFSTLYTFTNSSEGFDPQGWLVLSSNTLYGTTAYGGSAGYGVVFKLNTDGSGFARLYNFTNGSDGGQPYAGLVLSGTTLYGTANSFGSGFYGTVFKVNIDGTGFTNLHAFSSGGDGANPRGCPILAGNAIFGSTAYGGTAGRGTVFRINTDGTGYTNLYSFPATSNGYSGTNTDGASPFAGLVWSGDTLYGTAYQGGTAGRGAVFRLNTDGTCFTNLHNFSATDPATGTNADGAFPQSSLIVSANTLYGAAFAGGPGASGTLFELSTDGDHFTTLHSFSPLDPPFMANATNSDGGWPPAALLLSGNVLYGVTANGGSDGYGTVFALSLPPAAITLNAQLLDNAIILTWPDPSFHLQAAPDPAGGFTNIPAAASPFTNTFTDAQMFFRLKSN